VYTAAGPTNPDTWPIFVNKLFEKTASKEKFEIILRNIYFSPIISKTQIKLQF
jgi:hypothetical protein